MEIKKNYTEVLIDKKVYTLGGTEDVGYLQKIASYVNHKLKELRSQAGFSKLDEDYQQLMLEINMADDYFKAQETADALRQQKEEIERDVYGLKHDLINTQIKLERAQSQIEELESALSKAVSLASSTAGVRSEQTPENHFPAKPQTPTTDAGKPASSPDGNWGEIMVEDLGDYDDSIAGDLLGLDYALNDGAEDEEPEEDEAPEDDDLPDEFFGNADNVLIDEMEEPEEPEETGEPEAFEEADELEDIEESDESGKSGESDESGESGESDELEKLEESQESDKVDELEALEEPEELEEIDEPKGLNALNEPDKAEESSTETVSDDEFFLEENIAESKELESTETELTKAVDKLETAEKQEEVLEIPEDEYFDEEEEWDDKEWEEKDWDEPDFKIESQEDSSEKAEGSEKPQEVLSEQPKEEQNQEELETLNQEQSKESPQEQVEESVQEQNQQSAQEQDEEPVQEPKEEPTQEQKELEEKRKREKEEMEKRKAIEAAKMAAAQLFQNRPVQNRPPSFPIQNRVRPRDFR